MCEWWFGKYQYMCNTCKSQLLLSQVPNHYMWEKYVKTMVNELAGMCLLSWWWCLKLVSLPLVELWFTFCVGELVLIIQRGVQKRSFYGMKLPSFPFLQATSRRSRNDLHWWILWVQKWSFRFTCYEPRYVLVRGFVVCNKQMSPITKLFTTTLQVIEEQAVIGVPGS